MLQTFAFYARLNKSNNYIFLASLNKKITETKGISCDFDAINLYISLPFVKVYAGKRQE